MKELHDSITVVGNAPFIVPSEDFMISPLSADTKLYIRSLESGVINSKEVASIKANEYTKVHGSIPYVEFYIDTTDTFYVKY